MRRWGLCLAAAVALALAVPACGGDSPDGGVADAGGSDDVEGPGADGLTPGADTAAATDEGTPSPTIAAVETLVAPGAVVVGEEATVTCSATDDKGVAVAAEFAIDVTPAGAALTGTTFVSEVAGAFQIACRALPDGPADGTPFALVVRPGPAAAVIASVEPASIEAGGQARVSCRMEDAFGNEVPATGWTVQAPQEVTVNGLDVTATVAGEYELGCQPAGGAGGALEQTPARLTVRPGAAVGIALTATPRRAWYAVGGRVTIGYEVRDAHGNALDEDRGALTVTVAPAVGLTPDATVANRFQFAAKGVYTVHGSVPGPPVGEAELTLVCDPDPPTIELQQPERGTTQSTPALLTVSGRAHDVVAGLAAVRINGTTVAFAGDGAFSLPLGLRQGLNLVVVQAEDAVGHVAEVMRSVYYSPVWYAVDPAVPGAGLVSSALLGFLDRLFFYAEQDPGLVTVSSLVGDIVRNVDVNALLPAGEPITRSKLPLCGVDSNIYLSDVHYSMPAQVTIGGRTVSNPLLNPIDGGLHVFLLIQDLNAALQIESPGGGFPCLNEDGRVLADRITLTADVFISLDASGAPRIDVQSVSVTASGVRTQGMGITGALVNLLAEWLTDFLTGMIEDAVVDQLDSLLGGLTEVLVLDFEFELDPFIGAGDPTTLRIETDFARFEFTGAEPTAGLHLNAGARFVTTTPRVDRPVLGSIGRGACLGAPESFALAEVDRVELAIAHDVLNEALFALWKGGMLTLDVTAADFGDTDLSQFGLSDLTLQTDPLLPPIATSCTADGQLVAQVGDFRVHATFGLFGEPTDVTAYLHTEIALDPVVVAGEAGPEPGIRISGIRFLEAEIVELNEDQEDQRTLLQGLLEQALPTVLMNEVAAEPISFAIPPLDLGSLDDSGVLPAGVVLQILIDALGDELGYITAVGDVDRAAPAAP
jgi:hypothetical protein